MAPDGLEYLGPAGSPDTALASVSGEVREWFLGRHEQLTPIQCLSWPALVAGKNVVLSPPTGSGKTLAAFVPILNELFEDPQAEGIRCLYLAPLKALCNDAAKNLRRHLTELQEFRRGNPVELRVAVRTGDTPACERRE